MQVADSGFECLMDCGEGLGLLTLVGVAVVAFLAALVVWLRTSRRSS